MRALVSLAILALLLVGVTPAVTVTVIAQDASLLDLLPTVAEIGGDFEASDDRLRTLDEQANAFSDAPEAARQLPAWNWQENAFRVFQSSDRSPAGAPLATLEISLTRFARGEDAAAAMPFFVGDRAASTGQQETRTLPPIGDEARALSGFIGDAFDDTLYVRSGPLLLRISAASATGSPALSPEQIARGIIDRADLPSPATVAAQPAPTSLSGLLPEALSLNDADCFRVEGEGALDSAGVVERLAGGSEATAMVEELGWLEGAYRQFACDPPPGGTGWVDLSVHRFDEAQSAADAVTSFAGARAQSTRMQPELAIGLGDRSAALAGQAVNGTEYTLYFSSGPRLFAVTGVAPEGDPRADVEAIATALYEQSLAAPEGALPTPTPQIIVVPTATARPAPPPAPTIAPLSTATPAPIATVAPVPTTIPVVIPTTVPTVIPTAVPTSIPVTAPTAPPQATAPAGPLPTPTPRVIRPPTPVGE